MFRKSSPGSKCTAHAQRLGEDLEKLVRGSEFVDCERRALVVHHGLLEGVAVERGLNRLALLGHRVDVRRARRAARKTHGVDRVDAVDVARVVVVERLQQHRVDDADR